MFNGLTNANVGAAAADVPGHRYVNVGVIRMRVARKKRDCGHDLSGLAVAALHHLEIEPSSLDLSAGVRIPNGLDGHDGCIADAADGRYAGTDGGPIQMDRAGAAQGHAATKLRSSHAENIPQDPKQRRVVVDIDTMRRAVYLDSDSQQPSPNYRVTSAPHKDATFCIL
jgi:hypothetical protein